MSDLRNAIFEDKFKFLEALYLFVDITYDATPLKLSKLSLDRKIADYFDTITKLGYEKWGNDKEFIYGLGYILIYYDLYIDQDFVNKVKYQINIADPGNPLFDLYNGNIIFKDNYSDDERNVFFNLNIATNKIYIRFLLKYGKLAEYIVNTHWRSDINLLEL
jgi:hypothetical protein